MGRAELLSEYDTLTAASYDLREKLAKVEARREELRKLLAAEGGTPGAVAAAPIQSKDAVFDFESDTRVAPLKQPRRSK